MGCQIEHMKDSCEILLFKNGHQPFFQQIIIKSHTVSACYKLGFIGSNGFAGDHTAAVGQDYFMVLCSCVKSHFRPVILILCGA